MIIVVSFQLIISSVIFAILAYSQYNFPVDYSKYTNLKYADCSQVLNFIIRVYQCYYNTYFSLLGMQFSTNRYHRKPINRFHVPHTHISALIRL